MLKMTKSYLLGVTLLVSGILSASPLNIYVSPTGNDANSGILNEPLKTNRYA